MRGELSGTRGLGKAELIRIAAVGDIHIGRDMTGSLRVSLSHVRERADILLLAGDLTQHGDPAEGEIVARELAAVGVPIVSVLGNHEYHQGQQQRIRDRLEAAGVIVLEGEGTVLNVGGQRVGVGGVKGFGGGFAGACGSEFGEDEMKAFIRHSRLRAEALHEALSHLECDFKIALTHFSPTKGTLVGEKPEIHPFLGSYFLGEAIDATGCHLALHGHAHLGTERAVTPGGVPVRNVARPVIKLAYKLYAFGDRADVELAATEYVASASSARVSAIPAARQSG